MAIDRGHFLNMVRAALLTAVLFLSSSWPAYADKPDGIYIRAGRLVDVAAGRVETNRCIWIQGERIRSVADCGEPPINVRQLDWSDMTVLPGLIDLHTHLADTGQSADVAAPLHISPAATALIGAHNARTTLMAGFTTVRDVGTYRGLTDVALRDAIAQGLVPGPRMFVAGGYITIPMGGGELNGVISNDLLPADMRLGVSADASETREKAEYLFDHGVDFLKLIVTGAVLAIGTEPGQPELSFDQIAAAVAVARERGSYATAHAHGAEGIKTAIRAGVRSIEHASLIDDEGVQMAHDAGTYLVMDIFNGDYIAEVGTAEGWPEEYLRKNRETTDLQRAGFEKAVKAGVKLAFGTDSGVYPHGLNGRQFAYMVRYGMTEMQAIASATKVAAELLGHENELGQVATGYYADLIAVKGDPLSNIRLLEHVDHVVKNGELVK